MSFQILPATADDMRVWATITFEGYSSTPPNQAMFPDGPTPAVLAHMTASHTKALAKDADMYCLKVVGPDSGEIRAIAKWRRLRAGRKQQRAKQDQVDEYPPGSNIEAYRYFLDLIDEGQAEVMGDEPCWLLNTLITRPLHERKGYGTALIQWGTVKADAEGVDCFLTATAVGRPLYERCGFQSRKTTHMDFKPFGVYESYECYTMQRKSNVN